MTKKFKNIPELKSEEDTFEFWSSHDMTEYLDLSKAKRVNFPNLKPSSRSISLRLPVSILDDIKIMANKRDVPYQSFMKILIADAIAREKTGLKYQ
jgi:predicted DNA binding CopG/RHH family protein